MANQYKNPLHSDDPFCMALKWHFGVDDMPPLNRWGKRQLAEWFPALYELLGGILFRKETGMPVYQMEKAPNQTLARLSVLNIYEYYINKQSARQQRESGQASGQADSAPPPTPFSSQSTLSASEDTPNDNPTSSHKETLKTPTAETSRKRTGASEGVLRTTDPPVTFNLPAGATVFDYQLRFLSNSAAAHAAKITLDLFLEDRDVESRVVILGHALNYMRISHGILTFVDKLLRGMRNQGRCPTRIVVSTQEPTISPRLLSLFTLVLIQRLHSPAWFQALHGEAASIDNPLSGSGDQARGRREKKKADEAFTAFVELGLGEVAVRRPSATAGSGEGDGKDPEELGTVLMKVRIEGRLTEDRGGNTCPEGPEVNAANILMGMSRS